MSDTKAADTTMAEQPAVAQPEVQATETAVAKPTESAAEPAAESKSEEKTEAASESTEKKSEDKQDSRDSGRWERGRGRGRGRGNGRFERREKTKNTEFENLPESSDPVEIRQQVEFYFSDVNLSTDKHLFEEVKGSANEPVSIKHLHSFKRMRHFQPYSAVVAALRDSTVLDVVDTDKFTGAGNEGVKRKNPITIPTRPGDDEKTTLDVEEQFNRLFNRSKNSLDKSVYVKDFGDAAQAGQIQLEDFFRPYGSVLVRKRRNDANEWKGSVFVEFETEELQKQFLALDPKPKYKDNELVIMSKQAYSKMKCDEKGIVPNWERDPNGMDTRERKPFNRDQRGGRGGRGGRGRGGQRGGRGGRGRGGQDRNRERRENGDSRDNKRKADGEGDREEPKKAKVEIKEDA